MNMFSGETHTATTNADSRQTARQGQEMTHVRRFLGRGQPHRCPMSGLVAPPPPPALGLTVRSRIEL